MNKPMRKTPVPLPSFESGQIWQIGDTNLQIGLVGKRLVHYKHYKAQAKRPSTQLLGKSALESFLQKNAAILLPEVPPAPAPATRSSAPRRKPGRPAAAAKSN
jgi:hypothetical protein